MEFPARDLRQCMAQVPDPRGCKGRRHDFSAMLTAVVLATFCGAVGYKPIAQWLHGQSVDFWHFLGFTRRPPKYGAFRYLLMRVSVEPFEAAVSMWLEALTGQKLEPKARQAIAMDGKAMCGTRRAGEQAQMVIAAFDHQTRGVLRQLAVPANSNEITAARELLKRLVLANTVITADAAHCQQETCQQIVDSGGDYVITAKENQPELVKTIALEFAAKDAVFSPLHRGSTAV